LTPLDFTAIAINSGKTPWLFVAPNFSQTPQVLTILIDPSSLAKGTYNGLIRIGPGQSISAGSASIPIPFNIPVTLTVGSTGTTVTSP
jgi:hypothetical protein